MSDHNPAKGKMASSIADEVLEAAASGTQIQPFSERFENFDLATAYAAAAEVRRRREAGGERRTGYKIGFTNRNLWDRYGVRSPIWGDMYDTTVTDARDLTEPVSVSQFCEPLIEPEIVFGLERTPGPDMDVAALIGCIGWVAPGFEVVRSLFPGWHFAAADTVAGLGMHGRLIVGERQAITAADAVAWQQSLATFDVTLSCDGQVRERGMAADVLGGPLDALLHLVRGLWDVGGREILAAGDVVTTGSLTLALSVAPGETWRFDVSGLPVDPLELTIG